MVDTIGRGRGVDTIGRGRGVDTIGRGREGGNGGITGHYILQSSPKKSDLTPSPIITVESE